MEGLHLSVYILLLLTSQSAEISQMANNLCGRLGQPSYALDLFNVFSKFLASSHVSRRGTLGAQ